MVAELTPGTQAAGRLEEGGVIPVSQTLPDVNLDEILATLDADTRDYLRAAAQRRRRGPRLRAQGPRARAGDPAPRADREVRARDQRRRWPSGAANLARVVHNFSLLTDELGQRDTQLANFVQNSNAVFETLAEQDASLRPILQKLPGTLQTTQTTLGKVDDAGAGARADARVAAARRRARSARRCSQTRPFLRESTPIIRDEIRPFTRAALPTVQGAAPGDARPGGGRRPT